MPSIGIFKRDRIPPRRYHTITVQPGDTLSGLALHWTGDANRWPDIYAVVENRRAIDAATCARGVPGEGPHLIFPGTTLLIPRHLLRKEAA